MTDGRRQFNLVAGTVVCDFVTAANFVDIIQGDIGSGKTLGCLARIMVHAQQQRKSQRDGLRKSRWAIVRNNYPDLKRSTIRSWVEMYPEDVYGKMNWSQPPSHKIAFGDVRLEVDFLALDDESDISRLRSVEYTGIYFNELQYIEKPLFDEATSRVGRYPPRAEGGTEWRGVIADANAPEEDHWLAMMTGQVDMPPGVPEDDRAQYEWPADKTLPSGEVVRWRFWKQPPALLERRDERGLLIGYEVNPKAENLQNLDEGYYDRIMQGKSKAWIDTHLRNTISLVTDGSAVWPMFRRDFHVAPVILKPVLGHEVLVALDFGRVYPAALFSQEINSRINVQYELLGFNEGATIFAPKVKRFLAAHYPGYDVRFVGDPKGQDKGQADERSAYEVFAANGMRVLPAPVKQNNIDTRIEAVAYALNDNPSGVNRLVISPYCRTLIVGMAGKYHLVKEEDGETRPKKDKYSNLCDCLQYKCLSLGEGRRMVGLTPVTNLKPVKVYTGRKLMRRVSA